jgi:hypothetical protein
MLETEKLVGDVIHYLSTDTKLWKELIDIINKCHKENPYKILNESNSYSSELEISMWEEQSGINFPLMYICSIYLYIYAKKNNVDTYLFATRDCCHWAKIFKKMFPNEHCVYYNCSRNMFDESIHKGNKYFLDYTKSCMKSTPDRCIFVDIHGTGKRIFSYFKKEFNTFPYFFLISSSYRSYKHFPQISIDAKKEDKFINLIFDARGSPIEMLNYDIIGTMSTYTKKGAVRCEPEYLIEYLEPYHVCINYAISQLSEFNTSILSKYKIDDMKLLIKKIYRVIQDNQPSVSKYIKHPSKHPTTIKFEKKHSNIKK